MDWKKAMGLRDVITHAYTSINPRVIFQVCSESIPPLRDSLRKMLQEAP